MPELPEVEALAHHLREHAVGRTVARVDVSSLQALKTVRPPVSALHGLTVTGSDRHGKFLAVHTEGPSLVTHLSRAGWLRWSDSLATAPLRPGKGRTRACGSSRPPTRGRATRRPGARPG